MPVRFSIEAGPHAGIAPAEIKRRARAMLAAVQCSESEWSIVLTDDDQMRKLNRMYRNKDRPTDVLAFAQGEGLYAERSGPLLGDVVVSIPTARRQAQAARRDLEGEVTMLLAHGLLHLLGWDHDTPARDRRMRLETERLCAAAAAAPPARNKGRTRSGVKADARARAGSRRRA